MSSGLASDAASESGNSGNSSGRNSSCQDASSTSGSGVMSSTSGSHSGTSGTGSSTGFTATSRYAEDIAAKETKNVRRSRLLFVLVLFLVAFVAGAVTYILVEKEQEEDMSNEVCIRSFNLGCRTKRTIKSVSH
jgi:hypothetical protein